MPRKTQWPSRKRKELKYAILLVGFIEVLTGLFKLAN
jgi:hypothetical protein